MKKFNLICDQEHEFDGWFSDSEAIAAQAAQGFLDCPYCGSLNVRKRLSAPHLSTLKKDERLAPPAPKKPTQKMSEMAVMHMALKQLQKTIKAEFTDVGNHFADEARKIHKGEETPQNIYGQCSDSEREELADEGIEVFAVPWPNDDH